MIPLATYGSAIEGALASCCRTCRVAYAERLLFVAPRNATVTTEMDTTVLRIDGGVLLEVLEQAPMLTTALDRSNGGRPLLDVAAEAGRLVDDPRWARV